MSEEDYSKVEESLFAEIGEGENRDYYEGEVSEVNIPDPEEASKKFIEKYGDEGVKEDYENLDDDEENAHESFSSIKMDILDNSNPTFISNIIKENAESEDMFNTRRILNERIVKLNILSLEEADVYSRAITNKLWYRVKYNEKVENKISKILESL
jgi:hypothetical protein